MMYVQLVAISFVGVAIINMEGCVLSSAVQKSSGLAHVQVETKKSAHADYGSCYNVGH